MIELSFCSKQKVGVDKKKNPYCMYSATTRKTLQSGAFKYKQ